MANQARVRGYNSLDEYARLYEGLTPGQVQLRDKSLYNRLLKDGNLIHLPRQIREKGYDPLQEYYDLYCGVTRGKLHDLDSSLYAKLLKSGDIFIVPTNTKSYDDPLGLYYKNHLGLSFPELSRINKGLARRLIRDGLADRIEGYRPVKRS